jgi:hypothetical protein
MKPVCIFTVPRTGSQVVMRHFKCGGYDDAGELLTSYHHELTTIQPTNKAGDFVDRFRLHRIPTPEKFEDYTLFVSEEFTRRVTHVLESQGKPIVVKAFASTDMFRLKPLHIERVFQDMDVIVLRRRDPFKALLSVAICLELKTWHPAPWDMGATKNKLKQLKFEISEYLFTELLQGHNLLQQVTQNLEALNPAARVIYFEDFQTNPPQRLNELLNTNFEYEDHSTAFIEDHEAHVSNVERLRELYRKFSISQ